MGLLPIGLAALVFISLVQAAWARRKAFELRMQILEVAELAARRGRSMVPAFRKLALEQGRGTGRVLVRLARELERGEELSEALLWSAPRSFPPRVVAVIREADGTAQLAEVLASLVEQTEDSFAVQHRLAVALLYPLCLALGVLFAQEAVVGFYSYFPINAGYYGTSSSPPATGVLTNPCVDWFSLGDLFTGLPRKVSPWLVFSVGVLSTILVTHYAWRCSAVLRRLTTHVVGWIPWVSKTGRCLASSQFLMTLSHLVAAGQSLPAAMRRALGAAGSARLERSVQVAATALEAGQSANDAWRLSGLPEFAVASVTAATHSPSENLASALRRTSIVCRERFVARRERLLDLMHPLGLLLMGTVLAINFGVMISITGYFREATGLW